MIFESLWPLALLAAAVPAVIILYLLKPKGKDYRISSNLLWDKLFKNLQSKTFFEKFVHNILMYLQLLILLVLALALMSPYFHGEGKSGASVILVFDTSGSMQHDAGDGRTRMETALRQARELIADSEDTAFSVITADVTGTELLAVGVKDKNSLYAALDEVECCDGPGDLQSAQSVVETLRRAVQEAQEGGTDAEVIVFTDGNGAEDAMSFAGLFDARVRVTGRAVSNVANNFLSYTDADPERDGDDAGGEEPDPEGGRRIVCASGLTNYSDGEVSLELGLYEGDRLLEIKRMTLEAGETALCFFGEFSWQGEPLRSEFGSVRFADGGEDSLASDNVAYAVPERVEQAQAVLVGEGNTYVEKAYQAVTGTGLTRWESEALPPENSEIVYIYDADRENGLWDRVSSLTFGDGRNEAGTAQRVMLTASDCDLTLGMSSFAVGVNETKVYQVPQWGTGFLWAGEQCAGYYGEHDGVKTVVLGFDIRESDFPLKAEFPIFMSNVLGFLSDTSLLAQNVYQAGERVVFHPQADFDVAELFADTEKAGLYQVSAGEITERYVVRFATQSQSDGRLTAEGTSGEGSYGGGLVKRQLRNALLAFSLLLLAAEWVLYVRQTRCRSRFYLGVRIVCAALVLLAVCGLTVNRKNGVNTTVFLVDISNSNEQNLSAMEDYLDDAIGSMPGKNQYGIVTFGKDSLVEQFLTDEDRFRHIMSLPDKTATNFEEAVSRALAMLPAGGAGRLVILTDGRETKGDIANTLSALSSRQVELLALVYETVQGPDAYVEKVELPSYLYQGDAYTMTVTVESNYETDARIEIWMGTIPVQEYEVRLNRGVNRFQFRQKVTGENIESFQVRVAAPGDTCPENDSYHAYSVVDSLPRVLLVSGMNEDSGRFEELLRAAGCSYSAVSAINAPSTLEGLLEYKSVILENVFLSDLPEAFLANIETYVSDYGCGLICCGGPESYALGGYRDSVLETVLPVDMELRGVNEVPSTAMIMVIDHSGSMLTDAGSGATNLDLAIAAAETAVDQMSEKNFVGVISFDDKYSWVVEPVQASDKEGIKEKIRTIAAGGGTTIQPALWAALQGAQECDVQIRHVILLTDGQGESRNYADLTEAYKDAAVTLSAVAVGEDSDAALLERLAENCGGRYYYSDMASDIPKIFAQEVFLSGDTYLQNGEFTLAVNGQSEITRGLFENGWPKIYGYVSATPKGASSVLIASEKDDPVLTVMQYGLGRTAAWNTDVTNRWTGGFAGESDYVQLWKRLIDYSAGNSYIGEDSAEVLTAGGRTDIVYSARSYGEKTRVEAVYTDPEGVTRTRPLQAVAPGRFEAVLDTDITGLYNLSVRRIDGGSITNAVTTAAAVQYSDEYKFDVGTADFTDFVERCGSLLEPEDNFWRQRKSRAAESFPLTKWLILLAIVWFVADIALRRFQFRPQDTRLYRALGGRLEKLLRRRGARRGKESAGKVREADVQEPLPGEKSAEDAGGESRAKRAGKTSRKTQEPQTLDTSALLRKKDQRNQ